MKNNQFISMVFHTYILSMGVHLKQNHLFHLKSCIVSSAVLHCLGSQVDNCCNYKYLLMSTYQTTQNFNAKMHWLKNKNTYHFFLQHPPSHNVIQEDFCRRVLFGHKIIPIISIITHVPIFWWEENTEIRVAGDSKFNWSSALY